MRRAGGLLHWLCALVLLSLGLAHHAPPLSSVSSSAIAAVTEEYRLPDGSFAALCEGLDHGDNRHGIAPRCELCLLCASFLLPPPAATTWLLTDRRGIDNPLPQVAAVAESRAIPAPRSRAPPVRL